MKVEFQSSVAVSHISTLNCWCEEKKTSIPPVQVMKQVVTFSTEVEAGGLTPKFTMNTTNLKLWSSRLNNFPIHCVILWNLPDKFETTHNAVHMAMNLLLPGQQTQVWISL